MQNTISDKFGDVGWLNRLKIPICEYGDELSGFHKNREFIDQLDNIDSVPWSWLFWLLSSYFFLRFYRT
jgi:hypothetical protein